MLEILLVVVVIVVAVFAFAAWLCARVIGWIVRALTGPATPPQQAPVAWRSDVVPCPQLRCRAANAPHARFCRRCGKVVTTAATVAGRPAPMRYVA